MSDFDKMVQQKINRIRQRRESVNTVNDMFVTAIDNEDSDMEILSDEIYQKLMEE